MGHVLQRPKDLFLHHSHTNDEGILRTQINMVICPNQGLGQLRNEGKPADYRLCNQLDGR